jgi:rod shape-determining protein MreC
MARRGARRGGGSGIWIGAGSLALLIAVAGGFLMTGDRGGGLAAAGATVAGTVGGVVAAPVRWVEGAGGFIGSYFGGAAEVRRLKAENAALLEWRAQARAMAERLDAYEKLNRIQREDLPTGVSGRLVAESVGPFSRAGVVNVGARQGVAVNWIVLNGDGLVGRVIAVGEGSSRVLLLSDGDSRVPVMGEATRARAILTGDKGPAPRLVHLNAPAVIQDGERLMTSGDDGIFPRGIAVGLAGRAPDGQWRARLASDRTAVDFVRLVPPSNFPPPLDPVTPPSLAPPPAATATEAPAMPLAPGAAAIPAAATPDAIRAAQDAAARKTESELAAARLAARKLEAERDAARAAARKAEASAPRPAPEAAPPPVKVAPAAAEDAARKAAQPAPAAPAPPEPAPAAPEGGATNP